MASSTGGEIKIFLVADIRGYTKFTQDRGDEAGARLAMRFAKLVKEGLEHHNGSLIELRGDEALAVFTSPRQSLRAAVELQNRFVEETAADPSLPLRVGIGLDAGEAVEVDGGYRGAPLNVAARLCSLAAPGEVLASQGVVHLARRVEGLRFYEQGPTRLKGLDHPVTVFKVVAETANPYKGLRAFDEADAPDFFGREALTEQLVARLSEKTPESRFLAVVGSSGSGKSSVVRAGLVPALRRGALPGRYRCLVAVMVPGQQPMQEFAAALHRVADDEPDQVKAALDPADLLAEIERVVPPRGKFVLVIDQFEELFTLVEDEELRATFLETLRTSVLEPKGRVHVVLTLRADFYDRPLLYKDFGDLVGARTQTVTALSPHELERAVTGPAERAGVALEPGLVSQIVADVSSEPGALPLLQYALTELFEHRVGNTMTLEAYRDVGGVSGALVRRAELLYGELEPPDRDAARQLFLRLATSVNDVDVTRRRVARAEILSVVGDATVMESALDAFGAGRLLSFDRDPFTGTPTVEVAHEALLVEWSRLRGWLEAAREDLRAERRLAAAAREWIDSDRDDSFLVSGSRLERFEGWRESSGLAVTPEQGQFLEASRANWERLQAEDEVRQARERTLERRTLRRTRALVAVLGVAALVAGALTVFAFAQQKSAQREARTAVARELAAASVASLEVDPERSILLAMEAVEETRSADGSVLPEAEEALHQAVVASRIELSIPNIGGGLWSPKGVFYADRPKEDGVIEIRDASSGERVRIIKAHDIDLNGSELSEDGSMLATTGDDEKLKLWDATSGRLLSTWSGQGPAWGPSFDAKGSLLAGPWSREGVVRVIDIASGEVIATIPVKGATDTSFSPDGTRLAVSSRAVLEVSVFDVTTGRRLFRLPGGQAPVDGVAWSPDGRSIATAGNGAVGRVWDAVTGRLLFTLSAHTGSLVSVDWRHDSRRLVTGGLDGFAIVWDVTEDGATEVLRLSAEGTRSGLVAGFSPDGTRVITGAALDSSSTMIWDIALSGDAEWANFPVHESWPGNVEFSPDGRRLVATGRTDSVSIWELATGRKVRSIPARGATPEGSDFHRFDLSADGKSIATAGNDGTTRVWDVSTGKQRFTVVHPGGATSAFELGGGMRPSVAWSADGSHLVTSSPEGTTKIVDGTGSDVRVLREAGGFKFTDADISADDRLVVTVAWPPRLNSGDRVKVFERDSGELMTTIETEAHEVKFDPSGARVATGDERGVAQIWDVETGESLTKLLGHAGPVMDIAFSPDASTVATAGLDGTIRLWDAESGVQRLMLRAHQGAVYGVDFSPDGKKLATVGGGDGVARVWALDLDDLLEIAEEEVTRSLTDEECGQYLHLDQCPR